MKVTIELKSGKKLELTESEIQELIGMLTKQQAIPVPAPFYPYYPSFTPQTPINPFIPPYIVTCETRQ